jgi:hypothetical protein
VWALVETAFWFPSSGGRRSSVHGCGSVHAVVELRKDVRELHHLTGHYHHRPLAYVLGQAGFHLCLVSSMAVARTREALYNSWDKNDPKDAQVIATAGFRHRRLALNDLDDQRRLALGCPLIAKFCSL